MTLRELRKSKGLTQSECADILGISRRSYQDYENNYDNSESKRSNKYNDLYEKLFNYYNHDWLIKESNDLELYGYETNIMTESDLFYSCKRVSSYKKRDCYVILKKYIEGDYYSKICALYGLRRTGKTTLMFQMISELPIDKCVYIKMQVKDTMASLTNDLRKLKDKGYKYIFIDEVTLMEDFIDTSSVLADVFATIGMKIVVSGTDSLGFELAKENQLYDRAIMIHTSFIFFKEYNNLLNINSIDKYIEYGGTLRIENMSFDDPDMSSESVSFKDDESTRKYIDTSIAHNIQHALKTNSNYGMFGDLKVLYEKGELTNVINRIVQNMNHEFTLNIINNRFKSQDLGSAKNLLLNEQMPEVAYALYNIDSNEVINRLKKIIDIKEKDESTIEINDNTIKKIKKYLEMLDLIVNIPDYYEYDSIKDHYIFTQPGMRYSIAKALVYALMKDEYFNTLNEYNKNYITNKILDDVKGRILEEIILLETKMKQTNNEVLKFYFINGEIDMIVRNTINSTCDIYEIKHSDKVSNKQYKFLIDKEKCDLIEFRFGKIINKYVIYRGKSKIVNDNIKYVNVEEYLKRL